MYAKTNKLLQRIVGRWWLASLGILLVTSIAYLPGVHGPFVFDDMTNILLVPSMRMQTLDYHSLRDAAFWQMSSPGAGRPIAMASFALNYYFGGFDSFGYKTTNLIIHLLNAVLLWRLTLRLLNRTDTNSARNKIGEQTLPLLALVITSLWALHPLNLTSVLYVVQRMTSLATLFTVLGLLGYTIGRDRMANGKQHGLYVAAGSLLIFGLLATLTKEIGVLLPLYALVIEATVYRFGLTEPLKRRVWLFWCVLAAMAVVAATVLLVFKFNSIAGIFTYEFRTFTLTQRLLSEARAIWFYIRLIFIPTTSEMGIYHDDIPLSQDFFHPPDTIFAVIGILGLCAAAVANYRRRPVLSFGIGWFLAGHLLESTALPLELIHEHRNYLPLYGLVFAFAYYVLSPHPQLRKTIGARRTFIAIYLVLLTNVTFARALDWKDRWTLYSSDVQNHPNSARARSMLGVILHDSGQDALAQAQFTAAATLDPTDSTTMLRLVHHTYTITGHVPEEMLAELDYRLHVYPYSGVTLWNFEPLLKKTQPDKTLNLRLIHMFEHLIERTDVPLDTAWEATAYRTLGFAYREYGDYRSALANFLRAAEMSASPTNYLLAASMHLKLGDAKQAKHLVDLVLPHSTVLNEEDRTRLSVLEDSLVHSHPPSGNNSRANTHDGQ